MVFGFFLGFSYHADLMVTEDWLRMTCSLNEQTTWSISRYVPDLRLRTYYAITLYRTRRRDGRSLMRWNKTSVLTLQYLYNRHNLSHSDCNVFIIPRHHLCRA